MVEENLLGCGLSWEYFEIICERSLKQAALGHEGRWSAVRLVLNHVGVEDYEAAPVSNAWPVNFLCIQGVSRRTVAGPTRSWHSLSLSYIPNVAGVLLTRVT